MLTHPSQGQELKDQWSRNHPSNLNKVHLQQRKCEKVSYVTVMYTTEIRFGLLSDRLGFLNCEDSIIFNEYNAYQSSPPKLTQVLLTTAVTEPPPSRFIAFITPHDINRSASSGRLSLL